MIVTTLLLFLCGALFLLTGTLVAQMAWEEKDRTLTFCSGTLLILSSLCFFYSVEAYIGY